MKNFALIAVLSLLLSCGQEFAKIKVTDEKSKIIEKIFEEVSAENIEYLEEVFSDKMKMVNPKEMEFDKSSFILGIKDMYDLFDNITFESSDGDADGSEIETNYYSNGKVWTSIWNNFSATGKYTGQEINIPFHISYQWEGNKIIEEFQFFDMTAFENEATARNAQNNTSKKISFLIEMRINKGKKLNEIKSFLSELTSLMRKNEPEGYDYGYYISGDGKKVTILPGGKVIALLGILTITLTVTAHNVLHMPPILGMMFGLGMLGTYGYFLKTKFPGKNKFDIFVITGRAEWDTLLFFYGILVAVGGLASLGYLNLISGGMYETLGPTYANILVGILSAIIDNIPIVYAVLTAHPAMDMGQWLLITLTAGVGGSLLSIGSAAGVALMGQARGVYTFFAHLKWAWAILLGYAASIVVHLLMNQHLFDEIPLAR